MVGWTTVLTARESVLLLSVDHKPQTEENTHLYRQEIEVADLSIDLKNLKALMEYDTKADHVIFKVGKKPITYALPKKNTKKKRSLSQIWRDEFTKTKQKNRGNQGVDFDMTGGEGSLEKYEALLQKQQEDFYVDQALQQLNQPKRELLKPVEEYRWDERNVQIKFPKGWSTAQTKIKTMNYYLRMFSSKKDGLFAYLLARPIAHNETMKDEEIFNAFMSPNEEVKNWDIPKRDNSLDLKGFTKNFQSMAGGNQLMAGVKMVRGGCYYTLSVAGKASQEDLIKSNVILLSKTWKLIDPGKSVAAESLPPYQFEGGGFQVDLSKIPFVSAPSEFDHCFSASRMGLSLQMVEFDVGSVGLSLDKLAKAYFKITAAAQKMSPNEMKGLTFSPTKLSCGDAVMAKSKKTVQFLSINTHWQCWVVRNEDRLLVIFATMPEITPHTDRWGKSALSQVRKVPITGPLPQSISPKHQKQRSLIYNQFGIEAVENGRATDAIYFFKKALTLYAGDINMLENALQSMFNQGLYQKALDLLIQHESAYKNYQGAQVWKAALLLQVGRFNESATVYESLYQKGFREPEHLRFFILALQSTQKFKRAVEIAREMWKNSGTVIDRQTYAESLWAAGDQKEALEQYQALVQDAPKNETFTGDAVELLLELGRFQEVLESEKKWTQSGGPQSARILYLKGLAEMKLLRYKAAAESFQLVLSLAPGNEAVTRSLAQVRALLGQGSRQGLVEGLEVVPLPKSVQEASEKALARDSSRKLFKQYGAGIVRDVKVHTWKKGTNAKVTRYQTIEITGPSGINRYTTLLVPFHPLKDQVCINTLRVSNKEGKVVGTYRVEDVYVVDDTSGLATGGKVVQIPVPGVKEGVTIEFNYTIVKLGSSDSFPMVRRLMTQVYGPCIYQADVIFAKPEALKWKISGAVQQRSESDRLIFERFDTAPVRMGNRMPFLSEWLPYVIVADRNDSWSGLAQGYLQQIDSMLKDDSGVDMMIDELKLKGVPAPKMIQMVSAWIGRSFQYQGLEFGRHARIPAPAQKTMMRRFGDCKDFSVLAMALLKKAGVKVHLALVSSGDSLITEVPSLDQFDHMILYFPNVDGGVFMDPTAKYRSLAGAVPESLLMHQALVLDPSNPRFITIREPKTLMRKTTIKRSIQLDESTLELIVEETVTLSPAVAPYFRAYFSMTPPAQHTQIIQRVLQARGDRVVVEKLKVNGIEDTSGPFHLNFSYRLAGHANGWSGSGVIKIPCLWEYFLINESDHEKRDAPVKLYTDNRITSDVTFVLPNSSEFVDSEEKKLPETTAMLLTRSGQISTTPKQWKLQYQCDISAGDLKANQFAGFCKERRAAIDVLTQQIQLRKAP